MDVANEILDAIEIIVDKKIRENTAQIYPGICKSVSGSSCVMSINGKDNTIQFYGSIPTVGAIYRVFVPDGNMSMAFAITGNDDRKGLHYSNPNLLDNWYFGNPVNQRGQASYTGVAYGLDRWRATNDNTTVLISGGFITLSGNNAVPYIRQVFDNPSRLFGQVVTLSALLQNGTLKSATSKLPLSLPSANTLWCNIADVADLLGTSSYLSARIKAQSGGSNSIVAIKLELGSQQTLSHQDTDGNWVLNEIPDYGEQLARCQRYFQTFATESLRPTNALDFRPVMRATPALSTITVGGKTLYTASADL